MIAIIPHGVTKRFVVKAIDNALWFDANNILYQFCKKNARHQRESTIVAKLWLIGRCYAAPIERGAGGGHLDPIYQRTSRKLIESELDDLLSLLKPSEIPTSNLALCIHALVMECLPDKNKIPACRRSVASKYLHFHKPEQFVLFDTRAKLAASKFVRSDKTRTDFDNQYAAHARKCEAIKSKLLDEFGLKLNNRQLDEVLLAIADKHRVPIEHS